MRESPVRTEIDGAVLIVQTGCAVWGSGPAIHEARSIDIQPVDAVQVRALAARIFNRRQHVVGELVLQGGAPQVRIGRFDVWIDRTEGYAAQRLGAAGSGQRSRIVDGDGYDRHVSGG